MAKKAFFHKATIRTGHGSQVKFIPAQRQLDVIAALQNDIVKVDVTESVWWHVDIMLSSDGVYFTVIDNGLNFYNGDYGFEYLVNQFRPDYEAALNAWHGN